MNLVAPAVVLSVLAVPSMGMDFASKQVHELEQTYIEDCEEDTSPHGFYGAFLQPCSFTFFENKEDLEDTDVCTSDSSVVVGKPVPMHWFFNLTDHFDKDDWDEMSSDDIPDAEELMLWPDQCVGVAPRCYSLNNEVIQDILTKLFDELTEGATHVMVDCRGDAEQLSRVIYSFADKFERSIPTLIVWVVTIILLFLASTMWCCYGCFRLCYRGPATSAEYVTVATPVRGSKASVYMAVEDRPPEKEQLVKKMYQMELANK